MKIKYIDGNRLKEAVLAGAQQVIQKYHHLDEINVFPVPDGDTGTNMATTLLSVQEYLDTMQEEANISSVANVVAEATLLNARGNSGAILAQFFEGIATGFRGNERVQAQQLAITINRAAENAKAAMSEPKEGTIISVIHDWSVALQYATAKISDIQEILSHSLVVARASLKETTQKLSVLRKAGVVDAGAQGFVYFLEGIQQLLQTGRGQDSELMDRSSLTVAFHKQEVDYHATFRYCTECIISGKELSREVILKALNPYGDSLVIAGNDRKMRIHIHSDSPKTVFEVLTAYGEISRRKADDMKLQFKDAFGLQKKSIGIVVDSGCDLSQSYLEENQIHVVPLQVNFGTERFIDGITIDAPQFYQMLQENPNHPKSSQPAPADFERVYKLVTNQYRDVLSFHVPELLSGTMQVAKSMGKKYGNRINYIDCKAVSIGTGIIVRRAVSYIQKLENKQEIIEKIQKDVLNLSTYIALPTVSYLVKGGRLSKTKGLVGRFLNVKPILSFQEDGTLGLVDRAIGNQNVHELLMQKIIEKYKNQKKLILAVGHGNAPEIAEKYASVLTEQLNPVDLFIEEISPVLAVHGGPGVAGVSILGEK